jgi:hypothetical protein
VNTGLHGFEQVPLIWQRIEAEEARGNDAAVWELEQELLSLARRHSDDVRAVPILHEMADRQMKVIDRVLDGETPPEVRYGCFYNTWPNDGAGSCDAGSRRDVVRNMLAEAQRNYADAIAVVLRNEEYSNDELRELEMELLRGADLIRSEYDDERRGITGSRVITRDEIPVPLVPGVGIAEIREPWRSRIAPVLELAKWEFADGSEESSEASFLYENEPRERRLRDPYHRGRQSLRRLYSYGAMSEGSALRQATALTMMADWDLLFAHHGFAIDGYELARSMLERAGEPEASLKQLFTPVTPVLLPSFQPNPLARDDTRRVTGHIDVEFRLTRYGRARDVEIREASNATEAAQHELVVLLKSNRFRPRLTDGVFADESPVAFRYYVYD